MMIDVREAAAGPELNVACAEAMGWKWAVTPPDYHGEHGGEKVLVPPGRTLSDFESVLPRVGPIGHIGVKDYSGNIAIAWELVEALGRWWFKIEKLSEARPWQASFIARSGFSYWAEADTAPLAISQAFLLAHGITEIEISE